MNKTSRLFIIIMVLILAVYGGYQGYLIVNKPVKTQPLIYSVTEDKIVSEALFFKEEIIITTNLKGNLVYMTEDGARVGKDQKIASVYTGADSDVIYEKINSIQTQIEQLEYGKTNTDVYKADMTKLDRQINEAITNMHYSLSKSSSDEYYKALDEMQKLLNKKQVINGNTQAIDEKIAELKSELDKLNNKLSSLKAVYSDYTGYFSFNYDGYENLLDYSKLQKFSVEDFDNIVNMPPDYNVPENYVGKIYPGYSSYIMLKLPNEQAEKMLKSKNIKIRIPTNSDALISVSVYSKKEENGYTLVTLQTDIQYENFTQIRCEEIEVVLNSYKGFKIIPQALKLIDNETGIYVLSGQIVKFYKVDLLYTGEDFVVITPSSGELLLEKDDIIIEGKDLYDGKIIT